MVDRKAGRCFWWTLDLIEKISYPIPAFKKLREWGDKKSLKGDPLFAEDIIKTGL